MRVLAIETAFDICGVEFVTEDGIESLADQRAPQKHNQILSLTVERMMAAAGYTFSDLDGIALSAGPGSYTGLRIGMSYAKGLAFGTGLPIIPVPSLPVLLEGEPIEAPDWLAVWSHGENVYAVQQDGQEEWGEVEFMQWDQFVERATNCTVAGYLPERFLPRSQIAYVETCPSAAKVGKFAIKRPDWRVFDITDLTPNYHQEFQVRMQKHADS
jgi:tRNA threonylcarbamoyl adenosine modification protein YeaZ